jgi:hypothetical protein
MEMEWYGGSKRKGGNNTGGNTGGNKVTNKAYLTDEEVPVDSPEKNQKMGDLEELIDSKNLEILSLKTEVSLYYLIILGSRLKNRKDILGARR